MKKLSKSERILQQKPSHVIDASVLVGAFDSKDTKNQEFCEHYIRAIAHKYRGFTTFSMLGETFGAISISNDDVFKFRYEEVR